MKQKKKAELKEKMVKPGGQEGVGGGKGGEGRGLTLPWLLSLDTRSLLL